MAICETCDYANRPPYKSPCSECDKTMGSPFCCYEHEEKPTNADRIRAMSDEELAELFYGLCWNGEHCYSCPLYGKDCAGIGGLENWKDWMKKTAQEPPKGVEK